MMASGSPTIQHTSGAWAIEGGCVYAVDGDERQERVSDDGRPFVYHTGMVALVYARNGGSMQANARLIAAAPEMLIILRETLVALPNHTPDCPMGPGPVRIQPSGAACCLFSETHANARALLAGQGALTMSTTTIPERVVATITPESLPPQRYRIRCCQCGRSSASDSRSYVDAYAESHVREHGHTVEILERTDGPRVGVGDEGVE